MRGNGIKKFLAPSTFHEDPTHPDTFGFTVSYVVRVKVLMQPAILKCGVEAQVPVYLMAKPCGSLQTFGQIRTR